MGPGSKADCSSLAAAVGVGGASSLKGVCIAILLRSEKSVEALLLSMHSSSGLGGLDPGSQAC